jgi:hypothetical protein
LAISEYVFHANEPLGDSPGIPIARHSLPNSFDLAPLALYSGKGLGVRGFALCFDWFFDCEFNA